MQLSLGDRAARQIDVVVGTHMFSVFGTILSRSQSKPPSTQSQIAREDALASSPASLRGQGRYRISAEISHLEVEVLVGGEEVGRVELLLERDQAFVIRPVRLSNPVLSLFQRVLERIHIHRALGEGLQCIPAFTAPAYDLFGLGGIIRRGMDVDAVVIVAMRERRVLGPNAARRAMELLKCDGGDGRRQGAAVGDQHLDGRTTESAEDARLVVVAPSGWPGLIKQRLDLDVRLRRDEVRQWPSERPQRLQSLFPPIKGSTETGTDDHGRITVRGCRQDRK